MVKCVECGTKYYAIKLGRCPKCGLMCPIFSGDKPVNASATRLRKEGKL